MFQVSLAVIKYFTKNKEAEYCEVIDHNFIRPPYFLTFMKVGQLTEEQTEPIPFVIEWIPNFLRATNFGELKLSFQFGHEEKINNF